MLSRKCFGILLSLLLLVSQSGMALHVHYCGGEVASVKPVFKVSDEDGCGGSSAKKKPCCKDKVVKADKKTDTVIKTFSIGFDAFAVPEASVFIPMPMLSAVASVKNQNFGSVSTNGPPLYLLYSQYIFYA